MNKWSKLIFISPTGHNKEKKRDLPNSVIFFQITCTELFLAEKYILDI